MQTKSIYSIRAGVKNKHIKTVTSRLSLEHFLPKFPFYFLVIVTSYRSFDAIRTYLDRQSISGGVSPYALVMVLNVLIGVSLLLSRMIISKKVSRIIFVALIYVAVAVVSTIVSGLYPLTRIPFRVVELAYWVIVLIISYYSSTINNDITKPIIITAAVLPLFFLSFLTVLVENLSFDRNLLMNNVYYLLFLLPFILSLKSSILKYLGILIIFTAVVLSLKRTAIITFVISMLFFFFSQGQLLRKRFSSYIKSTFLLILCVFFGYVIFNYVTGAFSIDWNVRFIALLTDGGSGRNELWKNTWTAFTDQNILHWMLGNGYRATEFLGGAHNDFLEVLYDFGVIGLSVYFLFIVLLVKYLLEMIKDKYPFYPAYGVSIIIFIICSVFSQLVILPYWFLYLPLFWGLIIPHFFQSKLRPFIEGSTS